MDKQVTIYDQGESLAIHNYRQHCRYTSRFPDPLPDESQTLDGPKSGQSPVYAKAKADSKAKTKTNPPVAHTGPARRSSKHTHVPSLDDVLKFAEANGVPAPLARKFLYHHDGLRSAWENVNWQNKLNGRHEMDLAPAASQPCRISYFFRLLTAAQDGRQATWQPAGDVFRPRTVSSPSRGLPKPSRAILAFLGAC